MQKRKLGNSGLETSALVLGGNVFGWTADEATSFVLLDAYVAAGGNCIDTADVYSRWVPGHEGGESETVIGKWMKQRGNRAKVLIATKVGMEMGPDKKGLKRAYILRAVEDSLARLQTDHIDLYQSHIDDPDTPVEEPLEAYAQLIKQGKVRAIGASNFGAERLRAALQASEQGGLPVYRQLGRRVGVAEDAVLHARSQRIDDRRRAAEVHVRDPQRVHVAAGVAAPLAAGRGGAVDGGVEVEGGHRGLGLRCGGLPACYCCMEGYHWLRCPIRPSKTATSMPSSPWARSGRTPRTCCSSRRATAAISSMLCCPGA
jgi:diketogulonate reductase-like aldo/keto reductase